MKRIALSILLSLTIIAGCDTAQKLAPVDAKSEPKSDEIGAEWIPQRQPEGHMKVELMQANAKVEITSLGETDGIIPVKLKVLSYGNINGNPRNADSWQVNILLTKRNFVSQRLSITRSNMSSPMPGGTATLARLSLGKGHREESFRRASSVYDLPMAYPTYIPAGFTLEKAEFDDDIAPGTRPSANLAMVWEKSGQVVSLDFRHEDRPRVRGLIKPRSKPKKKPEAVIINDGLTAELSHSSDPAEGSRVSFLIDGQEAPWTMFASGLPKSEVIKIIKGLRTVQ